MFRLLRHRRGVAAVEFALIAPILLILLGAAVDLARVVDLGLRLEASARAGAQVILRDPTAVPDNVVAAMSNAYFPATPSSPTPTYSAPAASTCACLNGSTGAATVASCTDNSITTCATGVARYRTVTVTSAFSPTLPPALVSFMNITQLSRDVTVRI